VFGGGGVGGGVSSSLWGRGVFAAAYVGGRLEA
jgi:hypothetical protein